jgi:hypothetical protein
MLSSKSSRPQEIEHRQRFSVASSLAERADWRLAFRSLKADSLSAGVAFFTGSPQQAVSPPFDNRSFSEDKPAARCLTHSANGSESRATQEPAKKQITGVAGLFCSEVSGLSPSGLT